MRNIVACNDLLKYASLRAEPDYGYVSAFLVKYLETRRYQVSFLKKAESVLVSV